MAPKPNYQQQRGDRERSKEQKKQEKLAQRRERSRQQDAHTVTSDQENAKVGSVAETPGSPDPSVNQE